MKRVIGMFCLLISVFLLTSCSVQDFTDALDDIDKAVNRLFSDDSEEDEADEEKQCSDNECIIDAFNKCEWATGTYEGVDVKAKLSVLPDGEDCEYTYEVLEHQDPEARGLRFECRGAPSEKSIHEYFVHENEDCTGSIYSLMEPSLSYDASQGILLSDMSVQGDEFTFNLKNSKQIYLKSVVFRGGFLENCVMEFSMPVKLPVNLEQEFTLGCDAIRGRSDRVFGNLKVIYYLDSGFEDEKTIIGTFVVER